MQGLGSCVDAMWVLPDIAEGYGRLDTFARLIAFDRRGTGASDGLPNGELPTWESLAEDAGAVLDAAGSTQAAVVALADTGPLAMLFAATHPDRVSALVLLNTFARYLIADDYPIGIEP